MRSLHPGESSFLRLLTFYGLSYSVLHISKTGLAKGYTDATAAFRGFLAQEGIHDFASQGAGRGLIKYVDAIALSADGDTDVKVSFQRPATKGGRMFRVSKLGALKPVLELKPDDMLLCLVEKSKLHLANLTAITTRNYDAGTSSTLPGEARGTTIVKSAQELVLSVMRSMPECRAGSGTGAKNSEIGELSGMLLDRSRLAIANAILEELVADSLVEVVSSKPRRYRLCR